MILDKIIAHKKCEVDLKRDELKKLTKKDLKPNIKGKFKNALSEKDMSIIAEVKKASPSKGILREDFDPEGLAISYEKSGARAISVLTDNEFFKGSNEYLKNVKKAVNLSILRKDFIIDPLQIYEALDIGADAILLIAKVLTEKELKDYLNLASNLGLDALVEVHTEDEVKLALNAGAEIIGVNNRNLDTFETNIKRTVDLRKYIPEDKILVSESGIKSYKDVKLLNQSRVDAILVGESLVVSRDIEKKMRNLLRGE